MCSYLLISFWFTRLEALKSALKAVMVNKIGDVFLFLGLLITFFSLNSLDYGVIFNLTHLIKNYYVTFFGANIHLLTLISIFLLIGAVGKSAQIGLHIWLPDAMEGPTPVSALIHAATMVTAGVFLIIRCSFILEYSPSILSLLVIFGSLTSFLGATIALVQTDLKKIIAYSTCSQLGYMMMACGFSGYNVALYHLLNHAFFKALLFLTAGVIIHAVYDEQDLRKISFSSGLFLPKIVFWFTLIGSLSLMGFPGFSGFFSKDKILEIAYANSSFIGVIGGSLGTITVFLTSFYSFRLIYLAFCLSKRLFDKQFTVRAKYKEPHVSQHMILALYPLTFGSIFSGYLLETIFTGMGSLFFETSLLDLRYSVIFIQLEYIPIFLKMLPTFLFLLGSLLSYFFLHLT